MNSKTFQSLELRRRAWESHLQEIFQSLEIPQGLLADNIVESVAAYCRTFHPRGLQSADLKLLIARAFCAVGDSETAKQVLSSMYPHSNYVVRWIEILSELDHFPELLPYFSMGIIRPADWAGAQVDRMWILDFNRLVFSDAEQHEMLLYRSIQTLIKSMYVFWDATFGEGVLGLNGLDSLEIETVLKKESLTNSEELLNYIQRLFLQQRDVRNWKEIPKLLKMG